MKLTSGYDRNFLRSSGEEWKAFFHGANKDAIRLHAEGWLERRPYNRPEGGWQYRVNDAGRRALAEEGRS